MDRISIDWETGSDECVLAGTLQQLRQFISAIENAIESAEPRTIAGVDVQTSALRHNADIRSSNVISISSVVVCNSDKDKKALIKKLTSE